MFSENLEVTINFHNEIPINIILQNQLEYKIESTDAAIKGQTVSSSYKQQYLKMVFKYKFLPLLRVETNNTRYQVWNM